MREKKEKKERKKSAIAAAMEVSKKAWTTSEGVTKFNSVSGTYRKGEKKRRRR